MPIYEYKCSKCKRSFSVLQKTGTTEEDTYAPDCGSNVVKKLFSAFSCSAAGGNYIRFQAGLMVATVAAGVSSC